MRVVRLFTNETCNQRCAFCHTRRERERPDFASGRALALRLDAAVQSGAQSLVLTGGEPLLRPDLESVVRAAKARGVERVELETNGLLLSSERLRTLCDAGLDRVRVHLPGWGEAWERATGSTAPFAALKRTLELLQREKVPFELALPLVRDTIDKIHDVPEQLFAHGLTPEALIVVVPHTAPDPESLAAPAAIAAALPRLSRAAKSHGLSIQLDAATGFPPCLLAHPLQFAHLYALTPGGRDRPEHRRIDACRSCTVADRCPGLPDPLTERLGTLQPKPIVDERVRRRLTVIGSVDEQVARELVTHSTMRRVEHAEVSSTIVRVNFLCNQSCHFCFVSTHLPTPPEREVEAAIIDAARRRGFVILSGGEPTLNPLLPRWIRLAKAEGALRVEVQTNATRLARPGVLRELHASGLDGVAVSLHAATAQTSDEITQAPGTFEESVAGLDALEASALPVDINYVFCTQNIDEFPDFIRLVANRWPSASVTVSVAGAFTALVPRTRALIPRVSDVRPALAEGLRLASHEGVRISSIQSACGVPLCQLPVGLETLLELPLVETDEREFLRTEECLRCDLRPRCHGVRRSYAELYGTDEFSAIRLDADKRPKANTI